MQPSITLTVVPQGAAGYATVTMVMCLEVDGGDVIQVLEHQAPVRYVELTEHSNIHAHAAVLFENAVRIISDKLALDSSRSVVLMAGNAIEQQKLF